MNKKKNKTGKSAVLVCVIAAIAVVGAGFGLNYISGQSEIRDTGVPLEASLDYPSVHFASYKLADGIPVTLAATSVERDISIVILDEDSQPVKNIAFEVLVTAPDGESRIFKDEEGAGKIYIEDLEPGEYMVALQQTGRLLVPEPIQIEVKAKVELAVIDNIAEKIVNARDVNAAEEDAAYGGKNIDQGPPPPPLKDTIPFYESKVITTSKEVTVPLMGDDGNQVVKYKPELNNGSLVYKDGPNIITPDPEGGDDIVTPKPVYTPVLDGNGWFTDFSATSPDGPPISGMSDILNTFIVASEPQFTVGSEPVTTYQGWQTFDGKRYYYDLNGKPVTGSQVIQGASYIFDASGALQQLARGVDVSTWQNAINWTQVRNSGIHFAMIRAGYRGYGSGVLVEDDKFRIHAQGAQAAGLKVGLYYFSQAINEREAVEEASAAIAIARKYGINVGYPIAIDIEYSNSARNGRADGISGATRTAVARAFCDTIRSAGYTPMIYASKSWFENPAFLNISQLTSYKIWLAHWAESTNYKGKIDMWQYTSSGTVPGISGRVDMNISYLGY